MLRYDLPVFEIDPVTENQHADCDRDECNAAQKQGDLAREAQSGHHELGVVPHPGD